MLLRILAQRFGTVPEAQAARVYQSDDDALQAIIEQIFDLKTLDEAMVLLKG
jgi:hypothetical protein